MVELSTAFREALAAEFNTENLDFILYVTNYYEKKYYDLPAKTIKIYANKISKRFLEKSSLLTINVEHVLREELISKIQTTDKLEYDLFRTTKRECEKMLLPSFKRFLKQNMDMVQQYLNQA